MDNEEFTQWLMGQNKMLLEHLQKQNEALVGIQETQKAFCQLIKSLLEPKITIDPIANKVLEEI